MIKFGFPKAGVSFLCSSIVSFLMVLSSTSCAQPGSNEGPVVSAKMKKSVSVPAVQTAGSRAVTELGDPMDKLSSGTVDLTLVRETIAKTVVWKDEGGGMEMEKITNAQTGPCWKLTGTGDWMGMGLKVNTRSGIADMSDYKMGTLRFKYRGKRGGFLVGVRSAGQPDDKIIWAWIDVSNSPGPDQWYKVVIPIREFMKEPSALDLKKVEQLFMLASVKANGYQPGDSFLLDEISWSKEPVGNN